MANFIIEDYRVIVGGSRVNSKNRVKITLNNGEVHRTRLSPDPITNYLYYADEKISGPFIQTEIGFFKASDIASIEVIPTKEKKPSGTFKTCQRCGGSGKYLRYGQCYGCGGSGRIELLK